MKRSRFSAPYQKYNIIFLACQATRQLAEAVFNPASDVQGHTAASGERSENPAIADVLGDAA
jgi:hypothetical protein